MAQQHHESIEWHYQWSDADLIILGPGALEIVISPQAQHTFTRDQPLAMDITPLVQRTWSIMLQDGIPLQLIATWRVGLPIDKTQCIMHIGDVCSWQVPVIFFKALVATLDRDPT